VPEVNKFNCTVLIKIQPDATVCRYLFTAKSLYMFRVSQHPSSGVLKAVSAASIVVLGFVTSPEKVYRAGG